MSAMTNDLEVDFRRAMFRTVTFTQRANSTAYSVGDRVYNATADGKVYECITAGTSAGSPPTFNTTLGATTTDGGVTWMALNVGLPQRPIFVGLIVATRGRSDSIRSTAVSTGDTVIPATPNGRIYRVTTAGTTGASEPTYPTTSGATVADGSAVWTEMTPDLEAMNANVQEPSGGSYARVALAPLDANWTAPDATGGVTRNAAVITFPAPTGNWGVVFGYFTVDRLTGGIKAFSAALTTPKTVNSSDPAPEFAIDALAFTFG